MFGEIVRGCLGELSRERPGEKCLDRHAGLQLSTRSGYDLCHTLVNGQTHRHTGSFSPAQPAELTTISCDISGLLVLLGFLCQ